MTLDSFTQRHKGFCFVEFETPEAAAAALAAMNGATLGACPITTERGQPALLLSLTCGGSCA